MLNSPHPHRLDDDDDHYLDDHPHHLDDDDIDHFDRHFYEVDEDAAAGGDEAAHTWKNGVGGSSV